MNHCSLLHHILLSTIFNILVDLPIEIAGGCPADWKEGREGPVKPAKIIYINNIKCF
jgi:hypothetical protein